MLRNGDFSFDDDENDYDGAKWSFAFRGDQSIVEVWGTSP